MNSALEIIKTISTTITALGIIAGCLYAAFGWYANVKKTKTDIDEMKEEQCLLCYGVLSCLDGLKQLGAK